MILFKFSTLILLSAILFTSCGKKKEKQDTAAVTAKQTFYVKGDISALYAGATLNKDTFLTTGNIEGFNDFLGVGYRVFTSIGIRETLPKNYKKLTEDEQRKVREKDQESSSENVKDDSQSSFSFSKINGNWIYQDKNNSLKLIFKEKYGKIYLDALEIANHDTVKLNTLHYSVSDNFDKFSFLAEGIFDEQEQGEVLFSFTFSLKTKEQLIGFSKEKEHFHYPLGPTKRAVLEKGSKVSLCGGSISWMKDEIENAFKTWNKYLPENYVSFEILEKYPPFSDVNTKCIYLIDNFAFSDPKGQTVTAGFVMPKYNIAKREIIDTDMIIGLEEWRTIFKARDYGQMDTENVDEKGRDDFALTALHEMGHIFGLGHAFTDDHDHDSIMSYRKDKKLTNYDIESIHNLYGPFYSEAQ